MKVIGLDAEGTTAARPMLHAKPGGAWIVGALLAVPSTSPDADDPSRIAVRSQESTGAGCSVVLRFDVPEAIAVLRRAGGLTYAEIARLCGVSRRTVHFWASGRPLDRDHEERLLRLLQTIRFLDRGASDANRAVLSMRGPDGRSVLDLLEEADHDAARLLAGRGRPGARRVLEPVSIELLISRSPPSPSELLGALHEPVHRHRGKSRRARVKRKRKRGSG